MVARRRFLIATLFMGAVLLSSCATVQKRDPLQVTVAGIEPIQGEGLELRMIVKLRVQNPNDSPIDFNGVSLEMNAQGKAFASGVSDERGSVPRFGETVIAVPVTISAFRMVRQAIGMMHDDGSGKVQYEMKGKLNSSTFGATRFVTKGEFDKPMRSGSATPPG